METISDTDDTSFATYCTAKVMGRNENEWLKYQTLCRDIAQRTDLCSQEMLVLKQTNALAYLGKRAQKEGGVYSKTQLRILTPEFVRVMAKTNTARRFARSPWLERLLGLIDEINRVQDQLSLRGNVLPFTGAKNMSGEIH